MKYFVKPPASLLGAILLSGLAAFVPARTASASTDFPAALKVALEAHFPGQTFCVPLCTACHKTTQGGPGNINVFGHNLEFHGPLALGNLNATEKVTKAVDAYFKATPGASDSQVNGKWDSDGDGISDEDELKVYSSPSVAGRLGEDQFCTDLAFGCGARIAPAAPPIDKVGLFSAGLVGLGLIFLRRSRRHRANH